MSNWINVAKTSDFLPGTWHAVDTDRVSLLVFNIDGKFYAIENLCTHDGGDLAGGWLEGEDIVCPRHGARFCVKTGAVTRAPAYEDLTTYPVRVEGEMVQVQDQN